MAQGYANNTGTHSNHRNFADWHYPLQLSWPTEVQNDGTTVTMAGVLNVSNKGSDGTGSRTISVKTIEEEKTVPISLALVSQLKINAGKLATNFAKSAGTMTSIPDSGVPIIENENFASTGTTSASGQGILDAVLSLGGENITTPATSGRIYEDKIVGAINEMEKLAVYANYSNYSDAGYAQYTVYYTDHSNTGTTYGQAGYAKTGWWCCYNDHNNFYSNHTNTANPIGTYTQSGYAQHGGASDGYGQTGWWCCYNNHVNNYANHENHNNAASGYSNYSVGYSNYSNSYSNYAKVAT